MTSIRLTLDIWASCKSSAWERNESRGHIYHHFPSLLGENSCRFKNVLSEGDTLSCYRICGTFEGLLRLPFLPPSPHWADFYTRAYAIHGIVTELYFDTQHKFVLKCVLPVCGSVKRKERCSVVLFLGPQSWIPHRSSTLWIVCQWGGRVAPFLYILSVLILVLKY